MCRPIALILMRDKGGISHSYNILRIVTSTSVSPILGPLARRFSQAPANSVPSERAFPVVSFIHPKLSNRLTPESVSQLQYILFAKWVDSLLV